jgi:hypothetical protein
MFIMNGLGVYEETPHSFPVRGRERKLCYPCLSRGPNRNFNGQNQGQTPDSHQLYPLAIYRKI